MNWPNIVPEDVESTEAGDLFVEEADDHVGEELELELVVVGRRLEVEDEADGGLRDDAAQSSTVAGQPVQTSLVQRHRL